MLTKYVVAMRVCLGDTGGIVTRGDFMPETEQSYFAQRAADERRKAQEAVDPRIAAAHARLAELHEEAGKQQPWEAIMVQEGWLTGPRL
jgi:hypothetical protein